jgi:hypothetical protein
MRASEIQMSIQAALNEQALAKIPAALFYRRLAKVGGRHCNFVGQLNHVLTQKICNHATPIDSMTDVQLQQFEKNCISQVTRHIKENAGERVALFTAGLQLDAYGKDGKVKLVGVMFERYANDMVRCSVYSGHNMSEMNKYGVLWVNRDEVDEMPEDQYDNLVFARAAFKMMGLTICGTAD